jgi:DNA-binding PadR family transcriptional regulator
MNSHKLNINPGIPRNPSEFAVLGALDAQDSHGYKIVLLLQDALSEVCWLGRSQIYALLLKLEKERLVTHKRVEQTNLPARKVYSLTPDGQAAFHKWVLSPVSHMRDLRVEFLIKLFFARLNSENTERGLLSLQLEECKLQLSRLMEIRSAASNRLVQEALDYRIAMARAACSWIESLINKSHCPSVQSGGSET